MPKFTVKSFGKMRFNPLSPQPLLETYEDLTEIVEPDWLKDENLDKILRYVIIVYDGESPVYKHEPDIKVRMRQAAELAGFDMQDADLLDSIYSHQYSFGATEPADDEEESTGIQYTPRLIANYLQRFSGSMEHAAIEALRFVYWESILKMMEPISGKGSKEELDATQKKKIISDQLPVYKQSIKDQLAELYGGDKDLVDVQEAKTRFNPESIGHVLKNQGR